MGFTYHNITGTKATTLIYANLNDGLSRGGDLSNGTKSNTSFGDNNTYMILTNIHSTDSVDVDLYLQTSDKTKFYDCNPNPDYPGGSPGTPCIEYNTIALTITDYPYYILKDVTIPVNATLRLDKEDLLFDNSLYALIIQLSASDSAVDVIINKIN